MFRLMKVLVLPTLAATIMAAALAAKTVQAAPVEFAALITPQADVTLHFEDASNRKVRLVQRSGKTSGDDPFDDTTMLEWGMHDMGADEAKGLGYLVFTHISGDIAYLRFHWHARMLPFPPGSNTPVLVGYWDITGGTGRYASLQGVGTLRIEVRSPTERYWSFEGDVAAAGE